ncbi:MAG: adenylosuccinate lyase [bacterium]
MIDRYTRENMGRIWSLDNKFQTYLDVELAVCRAYHKLGKIPIDVLAEIELHADFSLARINQIEYEVKHDMIAFLTCVNEHIGGASKYMHMGLTSSDVIDTALALQIKSANEIIEKDLIGLIEVIKKRAIEHKNTICIGRSHGIHAEPMTFGVKLCSWLDIFERNLKRFKLAAKEISIGQISGPVGTYSNISTKVEKLACEDLGLTPARISTQVIARDYHANYLQTLSLIASCIEQCAIEIRHLQRTEVLEVEEGFAKGQKGSSAMPHKKNPISSENLSGLARVVRANSIVALENIALWHERDISHSSSERIIFPDSTILIDYMLTRFKDTVENLVVYPETMLKNTKLYGGVIYSQRVMLALVEKGLSREEAYSIVQKNAHEAWNCPNGDFKANLLSDSDVIKSLNEQEIESCFDTKYYLSNINEIYKRFEV